MSSTVAIRSPDKTLETLVIDLKRKSKTLNSYIRERSNPLEQDVQCLGSSRVLRCSHEILLEGNEGALLKGILKDMASLLSKIIKQMELLMRTPTESKGGGTQRNYLHKNIKGLILKFLRNGNLVINNGKDFICQARLDTASSDTPTLFFSLSKPIDTLPMKRFTIRLNQDGEVLGELSEASEDSHEGGIEKFQL
jgi:hypothetical protein